MENNKLVYRALTEQIIGAAITVHKTIGPGLLESVYQQALTIELTHIGLRPVCQVPCYVTYRGVGLGLGYRADIVVNGLVLLELKAVEHVRQVHHAQILSYLRSTQLKVGLLINFNAPTIKDGLVRKILQ